MLKFEKPVLIIDTREQTPLNFQPFAAEFQHIIRGTLTEGDYSVYAQGDTRKIAFERKSLPDLVGTIIKGRDRFKRELERLQSYDYAAILIEASYGQVASDYGFSKVSPASILGSLQSFQLQYGVDVIFAGSRAASVEIIMRKVRSYYGEA